MPSLRDFSELLDQSQWWPPEKMVAWQRQQLRALLDHARSTSPYYKYRLNAAFRRDGTIDWEQWHKIPILRRADVLEHFETILSMAPPPQHGPFHDYLSSGSTGHPVKGRTTRWLVETSAACKWRTQQWAGLDWSRTMLSTTAVLEGRTVGENLGPWGPPWLENAQRGRNIYMHYHTDFPERFQLMVEKGVTYHSTTASTASRLVEEARSGNINIHLDSILLRGGAVSDLLRDDLRETFGADVLELYSSKECGAIAQRCPSGDGYHINSETVLVEIVDAEGLPVAPGEAGRAVITPFASTAFPLIRYDQGDIVVAGTTCSCGRGLPVIASISGREAHFLRHPDGRKADRTLTQEARELIGAGQVQIVQIGPTDFEVRYTPRDWGVAYNEARFIQTFRELYFEDANVRLVKLQEIPLSPAGKFLSFVVEWQPDGRPAAPS